MLTNRVNFSLAIPNLLLCSNVKGSGAFRFSNPDHCCAHRFRPKMAFNPGFVCDSRSHLSRYGVSAQGDRGTVGRSNWAICMRISSGKSPFFVSTPLRTSTPLNRYRFARKWKSPGVVDGRTEILILNWKINSIWIVIYLCIVNIISNGEFY